MPDRNLSSMFWKVFILTMAILGLVWSYPQNLDKRGSAESKRENKQMNYEFDIDNIKKYIEAVNNTRFEEAFTEFIYLNELETAEIAEEYLVPIILQKLNIIKELTVSDLEKDGEKFVNQTSTEALERHYDTLLWKLIYNIGGSIEDLEKWETEDVKQFSGYLSKYIIDYPSRVLQWNDCWDEKCDSDDDKNLENSAESNDEKNYGIDIDNLKTSIAAVNNIQFAQAFVKFFRLDETTNKNKEDLIKTIIKKLSIYVELKKSDLEKDNEQSVNQTSIEELESHMSYKLMLKLIYNVGQLKSIKNMEIEELKKFSAYLSKTIIDYPTNILQWDKCVRICYNGDSKKSARF